MVQRLIFNQGTNPNEIDFDFTLRGYTLADNQKDSMCFRRYISPGNPDETLQKDVFLHYTTDEYGIGHFWSWLEPSEIERFVCSRNVDVKLTVSRVANACTQTV